MAVPQHLDEAAARLTAASLRIEAARGQPASIESLHDWLEALTDYARALAELHEFANESIHEKLHELAGRLGLKDIPPMSAFTPH